MASKACLPCNLRPKNHESRSILIAPYTVYLSLLDAASYTVLWPVSLISTLGTAYCYSSCRGKRTRKRELTTMQEKVSFSPMAISRASGNAALVR